MNDLKLKCEYEKNGAALSTVTYTEGHQPKGEEFAPIRHQDFPVSSLPANIIDLCANYGLRAILADRTSDAKRLGVNKLDWMKEVYEMLSDGHWNKPRASNGKLDPALIQLIVNLKDCSHLEAETALKTLTKEQRDGLMQKYHEELIKVRTLLAASASDAPSLDDLI